MNNMISTQLQHDILQALSIFYPYPPSGKQYFSLFANVSEAKMAANIEALVDKKLIRRRAISHSDERPYIRLAYLHLTQKGFEYSVKYC